VTRAAVPRVSTFTVGDEIVVLPSGRRTTITAIDTFDGPLDHASAGRSVTILLADDLDISRGDLIAPVSGAPKPTQDLDATVTWMTDAPLRAGARYAVKHTTRIAKAVVREIQSVLDVETNGSHPADELRLNDIGRVSLRSATPLLTDTYRTNRTTGAFILIDEATGATHGAGLVEQVG